jgi:hypothetical protein
MGGTDGTGSVGAEDGLFAAQTEKGYFGKQQILLRRKRKPFCIPSSVVIFKKMNFAGSDIV